MIDQRKKLWNSDPFPLRKIQRERESENRSDEPERVQHGRADFISITFNNYNRVPDDKTGGDPRKKIIARRRGDVIVQINLNRPGKLSECVGRETESEPKSKTMDFTLAGKITEPGKNGRAYVRNRPVNIVYQSV